MYYLITSSYVGPNPDDECFVDYDTIEIHTTPAITNMNRQECLEGWCGTTNDISIYAHGEYATLEAARDALISKHGKVRQIDKDDDDWPYDDPEVLEVYKFGEYPAEALERTESWAYEIIDETITADTSDAEIDSLVESLERESNDEGYTREENLRHLITELRQELLDEREAERAAEIGD